MREVGVWGMGGMRGIGVGVRGGGVRGGGMRSMRNEEWEEEEWEEEEWEDINIVTGFDKTSLYLNFVFFFFFEIFISE